MKPLFPANGDPHRKAHYIEINTPDCGEHNSHRYIYTTAPASMALEGVDCKSQEVCPETVSTRIPA